jgi:hypothetical protein
MRTVYLGALSCILGALLILSCSSQRSSPSPNSGSAKSIALGDLTVDRCLIYIEGENFREKSGGDLDLKGGAYGKKCLGMRWGEKPTDFVSYDMNWEDTTESTLAVIRAAFEGANPQIYGIILDNKHLRYAALKPTGGYGYTEMEWNCFSIPLGRVEKGRHTLTIRSTERGGIINIDCIALGKAG